MNFTIYAYILIKMDVLIARFRQHLSVLLTLTAFWIPAAANAQISNQGKKWVEEFMAWVDLGANAVGILGALCAAVFFLIWIFKKSRNAQPDGEIQKVFYGIAAGSFWFIYSLIRGSIELGEGGQTTDDLFG